MGWDVHARRLIGGGACVDRCDAPPPPRSPTREGRGWRLAALDACRQHYVMGGRLGAIHGETWIQGDGGRYRGRAACFSAARSLSPSLSLALSRALWAAMVATPGASGACAGGRV